MLHEVQTLRTMCTDALTVDYQHIANGNIANQIRGFTIDCGKFILIRFIRFWLEKCWIRTLHSKRVFQPYKLQEPKNVDRIEPNTASCSVQGRKWPPTANDPQAGNDPKIGPQMIPNRKWSPSVDANDPSGKRGMAWSLFLRSRFQLT